MVSVLSGSKTAYLIISKKSTDLGIEEKIVIKGGKNMKLTEIGLQGTSGAENLYFA